MKILCTGGAGFLGSHLADALLAAGHEVTILDDLSGGFVRNTPSKARFIEGSVNNGALVNFLCRQERYDAIYHLAAYAAEGLSHFIRRFNYTNNVVGSANVINAAVEFEVKKLVFTSSIAVYGHGRADRRAFREEDTPAPIDPYGVAKYAVELDLAIAAEMWGLDYTIFRPHNIVGPRQHIGDRYRNVAGIFMNQLLRDQPLTIYGDGTQTRSFSYVSDIIGPMVACLPSEGGNWPARQIYNIGGDVPYSVNQLAEAVIAVSGKKDAMIVHLPERHEAKHAHCDHTKVWLTFGEQPKTSLEDGLRTMWEWAKALGPQDPLETPAVEMARGLPPSWQS
jgi:UDP-glucose 4-epimerase